MPTTTKISTYPIHQSPLYKLRNKRKLANIFKLSLKQLQILVSKNDNYIVFTSKKNSGKQRIVQAPKSHIERLHRKLFHLLTRIEPPDFLSSGVKGRSYLTNAKHHTGDHPVIKLDIAKFFQSTTAAKHIFNFFYKNMQCSKDVSGLLTKLCTYNNHLPTGSCLSQTLAFYAHLDMFNAINSLAKQYHLTMTCYVDDIVISGENATNKTLHEVRTIIKRNWLKSHKRKEKLYEKNQPKLITGIIIKNSECRIPNSKHKQIYDEFRQLDKLIDVSEKRHAIKKLLGRINSAAQVDPISFNWRTAKLKKLELMLSTKL